MDNNNNLLSLISRLHTRQNSCRDHLLDNYNNSNSDNSKYAVIIPADPVIGILYVTKALRFFLVVM